LDGFLSAISELAEKEVRRQLASPEAGASFVRFGTVTDVTGRPKVQFDGETAASGRRYPYLSSYTPTLNDRVMLLRGGSGAWVVIGKIV
jgi:hypothetical protein